jgi:hypothetical protein
VPRVLTRLRAAIAGERRLRVAWLAAIISVLAFYKIELTTHTFGSNADGGTYLDIAAHVRDGDGLVTNVSLTHLGFPRFPYPTGHYPLWPLIVGLAAKVFPLLDAGKWLATAFYFTTLGFAYLWGRALYPAPLLPRVAPGLGAGHVLVLMFGLHGCFFSFTSWPYTEGLAFTITCAALFRMTRLLPNPTWAGGLEIGAYCGLALLARFQLLLLAMAVFPVLVGACLLSSGPRRRYAAMTIAAAIAMLALVGPHYLYVRSYHPYFSPALYIDLPRAHVTEGLSVIPYMLDVKPVTAWVLDRLSGFAVAFDPRDKTFSYFSQYATFCCAVVAAVPLIVFHGARALTRRGARGAVSAAWSWVRRPENLNWVFVVVFATGCFTMIHATHMATDVSAPWWFHGRHGIVCMFAFFLSLVLLLAERALLVKLVGVAILCSGTTLGLTSIRSVANASLGARRPGPSALVGWLNDEATRRGGLIVAYRQPQPFSYLTPHVGYHWYYGGTTLKDIQKMVELGAAYVIVPGWQSFGFVSSSEFARSFHLVKTIEGARIYEPVAGQPPAASP